METTKIHSIEALMSRAGIGDATAVPRAASHGKRRGVAGRLWFSEVHKNFQKWTRIFQKSMRILKTL